MTETTNRVSVMKGRKKRCMPILLRILQLWIMISFVFLHYYLVAGTYTLVKQSKTVWRIFSQLFIIAVYAINVDYFLYYRLAIRTNLNSLMTQYALPTANLRSTIRRGYFALVVAIVYIIFTTAMTISVAIFAYDFEKQNSWMSAFCFKCDPGQLSSDVRMQFYIWSTFIYGATLYGSCTLFPLGYWFLYSYLAEHMDLLLSFLRLQKSLNLTLLKQIRRRYMQVYRMTELVNQTFGSLVLLWYGSSLASACYGSMVIARRFVERQISYLLLSYFLFFQMLVFLCALSFVVSRLVEKSEFVYHILNELTLQEQYAVANDQEFYSELQLLITQLESHPAGLMAGRCFLLTKRFFLSFLGAVVTYMTIAIQMK